MPETELQIKNYCKFQITDYRGFAQKLTKPRDWSASVSLAILLKGNKLLSILSGGQRDASRSGQLFLLFLCKADYRLFIIQITEFFVIQITEFFVI